MRAIRIFLFLILSVLSFGAKINSLSNIKTMEIVLKEKVFLNNKEKDSIYNLKYVKPNKARKEILAPKLNRGEIYIYVGNTKTVYLPMFDQVTREENTVDENDILQSLNYILNLENNKDFAKKYYSKKLDKIILEKGTQVYLKDFKIVDNYLLPYRFEIYENNSHMATLNIEDYKINPMISSKEFILDD